MIDGGDVLLERAQVLCDLRRYADAAELAGSVVATTPDRADAWCLLAFAHLKLAQPKRAADAAQRGLALAPEDDWVLRIASLTQQSVGQYASSVELARRAVAVAPSYWACHARLAFAALELRLIAEARAAAHRAAALAPAEPACQLLLADVALAAGRRRDARLSVEAALAVEPYNPTALACLAAASMSRYQHLRPNKMVSTIALAAAAVRADPRDEGARHALDSQLRSYFYAQSIAVYVTCMAVRNLARFGTGSRAFALVLLLLPIVYAAIVLVRIPAPARRGLGRFLGANTITGALGLEAIAVGLTLAAVWTNRPQGNGVMIAWLAALGAAVMSYLNVRRPVRAGRVTRPPLASSVTLWLLSGAFCGTGLWIALLATRHIVGAFGGGFFVLVGIALGAYRHYVARPWERQQRAVGRSSTR